MIILDNQKHINYRLVIFFIFSFSTIHVLQSFAQNRMNGPIKHKSINHLEKYGEGKNTFLDFYQKWISQVKGENKCPMYPSCSQYVKITYQALPWYKAYIKSHERLLRCGNELYLYPTVRINGSLRWYDPVITKDQKISKDSVQPIFNNFLYSQDHYDEGFANYLFKKGEYYRAITEYYRLLYICTDSTKKINLFRNIGLCHFHGADYEEYISFLKKHKVYFQSNSVIHTEMEIYLSKSYYYLNQYQKAISTLEWSNTSTNNSIFNEKRFLLGISYARIFDWQTAIKKMQMIKQGSPRKIHAENICRSLENFPKLPKRNPFLAGTLSSIIPGAGYVYCNRKGTGLTSFLVNGLLFWTIRDAIIKKQYGLATTTCFFGIGWYIGNIKGNIDIKKNEGNKSKKCEGCSEELGVANVITPNGKEKKFSKEIYSARFLIEPLVVFKRTAPDGRIYNDMSVKPFLWISRTDNAYIARNFLIAFENMVKTVTNKLS